LGCFGDVRPARVDPPRSPCFERAHTAFFVWIAIQMFGAWAQVSGFSNVSALAHLGGAGAGFACWLLYRDA